MDTSHVLAVLSRIEYKPNMWFAANYEPRRKMWTIQLKVETQDCDTGDFVAMVGAKAWVSEEMTDEQIVREAFKLCKAWEEHELLEFFKVDGRKVFDPHKPIL